MLRDFGSLLGWAFIPHYATKIVLEVYYGTAYKFGEKPKPGTVAYYNHYRRVHAALVLGYLLLTIYDAYDQIRKSGDFYQALGLEFDATERQIKSKFRRLAALYHPDKQTASTSATAEHVFVVLKKAQDTLINPTKRFAYDRFGPTMLDWEHCVSIKDYLQAGFQYHSPSYLGVGLMTLALGAMGYLDWGKFWRYTGGASLLLLEVYILTRPEFPWSLTHVINPVLAFLPYQKPLLPFQALALTRKVALAAAIAISRLGPSSKNENGGYDGVDDQRLGRLEFLTAVNEMDISRLLRMELAPFEGDPKALTALRGGMTSWLHQNTIRGDPLVRQAITQTVDPESAKEAAEAKAKKEAARKKALREQRGEPEPEVDESPQPESKIYNVL